jgi:hypothetical protein
MAGSNEDDPSIAQWLEDLARHAETGDILDLVNREHGPLVEIANERVSGQVIGTATQSGWPAQRT